MDKKTQTKLDKKLALQLENNPELVHSNDLKVESHVQREIDDWFLNTIMIEGYDVPFKYKRKKRYKSLNGALVNLTYYPEVENVAGFEIEVMKIVRLKRA